ncbi:MAG: Cof-type HAD-IIB family hydrolase [Acholeplasmatales bacterium]|jgi:Cof subfamily protein (haloacid dehalogenase superfamily)|nr:Cof-type HAD-IIB family hydrolase [Acholeplasmatales bacterium]
MRDIKLVIFDLDGTLLSSKKEILASSLVAIKRLYDNGISVGICSGRIYQMLEVYVKEIDLKGYVLATNAASIYQTELNKKIYGKGLHVDSARKIVEFCLENDIDCSLLTDDTCYFSKNSLRIERFKQYNKMAAKKNLKEIPLEHMDSFPVNIKEIEKVLIYSFDEELLDKSNKFLSTLKDINYNFSEEGLIDISCSDASKGIGVSKLMKLLDLKPDQVMVFGDYENDISMLDVVKFSVAMGNANSTTKEHANFITDTNDNDGIYKAICSIIFMEDVK